MKKKRLKKILCFVLTFILTLILCIPMNKKSVQAATAISGTSITAYTMSSQRVSTYTSVNGSYSGYIDADDQCTILEVYDSGWLKVNYPTVKGTKTAYAKSEDFFVNTNFSLGTIKLESNQTVYRKSDMSRKIGTAYEKDDIIIIGSQNSKTQILYPVSNGYKLGWIDEILYIVDGYYQIKSAVNPEYVVDIYGASLNDCANVQLYFNSDGENQIFYIKKVEGNYYIIIAKNSGKVLDVEKGGLESGTNIIQYSLNGEGSDNQLWELLANSDGTYSFRNKLNGLYLDLSGGVAENERNIQCWEENDTLAQDFILTRVGDSAEDFDKNSSALSYKVFSDGLGWLSEVTDGMTAGTTGKSAAVKAIEIRLQYGEESRITYRTHCTDIGWMDWKNSGETAGITDLPGAVEAVQIKLQNGMEDRYDIYYRAHCADYGWLGWAKNGETAGTIGYAKRMEALEIKIVEKSDAFDVGGEASHEKNQNAITEKLDSLIEQYNGTVWDGYYYGIQCKGFANMIFAELFDCYIGAYDLKTKSYIPNPKGAVEIGRLSADNMTQNAAKDILQKGQPGDYIQVRRRGKSYGHTMILVSSDSNGITVFDCNSDGKNGVRNYYITWKQFYSKNSAMSLYHAKNYE